MYKVLIVEDNFYDRDGISRYVNWQELGIVEILTAVNGNEGYEKAKNHNPDIIITDISMPEMTGLDMIKLLQSSQIDAKFIVMSCHDEFVFAQAAIKYGVSEYILKPVAIKEMESSLKRIIEQITEENLVEKNLVVLKQKLEVYLPSLQSDLLREIMIFDDDISDRVKKLEYLDMKFFSGTIVSIVKLDNYKVPSNKYNSNNFALLYILLEKLTQTFINSGKFYSYTLNKNSLCVIITDNWSSSDECYDDVINKLDYLKEEIFKESGHSITIAIGSYTSNLTDLPISFKRAQETANSCFFSKGNQIVLFSEISPGDFSNTIDYFEIERDINSILSGSRDYISNFVNKHFDINIENEDYIRNFCYISALFINKNMLEQDINFNLSHDSNLTLWKLVSSFDKVDKIKEWLLDLLYSATDFSDSSPNKRRKEITEQIKKRINQEYSSISSLSEIAKELFISPGYANNIFKQECGVTMGDYLFHIRMEKAKSLLKNPSNKIYEVSLKVGYVSKSYFTSCFKEYSGMTPKDYRDKFALGENVNC